MRRHDAILQLAAAAVDAPLAPADRARLTEHLDGCAPCSRAAAGMRADARELELLPAIALPAALAAELLGPVRHPAVVRHPLRLVLAAALLGLLLVGATLATGSGLLRLPSFLPPAPAPSVLLAPSAPPNADPSIAATPSAPVASPTLAAPSGASVAYTVVECTPTATRQTPGYCDRTFWLAAADGSGARKLPGEPAGWSADGTRLLLVGETSLILADAAGSAVATFPMTCLDKAGSCATAATVLCQYPCNMTDGFSLSPDATRVVYVRGYSGNTETTTVVTVLDLRTGRSTELAATRSTNPYMPSECPKLRTCQGLVDTPRWSPDGRQISFARQVTSPEPGTTWFGGAVYVVDENGSNLRRVTPTGLVAIDAVWSPDGTRFVFTSNEFVLSADRTTVASIPVDICTIGVDGSGLARLTDDGVSARGGWTSDGHLTFMREIGGGATGEATQGFENWAMDADGANPYRQGGSLAELTAAGCTTCVYPLAGPPTGMGPYRAYWQPTP